MLRHRQIDRIVCLALAVTLLLTGGLMGAAAGGLIEGTRVSGYEKRLFDQSRVHAIDIVMDDWDEFIAGCTDEEYVPCTVVIDGEAYGNVAIRAKGNTSLSQVSSYGNNRYSFKIEFDHYQTGMTYHGLDKLSLNNLIQDKTFMKDYLAYTLMGKMGVASPLCSFAQISVNGEPWGVYLAVEAVEDSFLSRNYGAAHGDLYKPDSMSFGGGRGNGKDFDMDEFRGQWDGGTDGNAENPDDTGAQRSKTRGAGGFDPSQSGGMGGGMGDMGGGMGGRGSADVMLQYIDDNADSYPNIFGNAKTDVSEADMQRLIMSLKTLSEGGDVESAADVEAVIRYLVVHDFLVNGDSYTGSMVHNYYLYEEDGVLSMIPWDYNLAFGAFSMGKTAQGAAAAVNSPIDSPVSSGDISSRPMISWIFASEEYTALYHEIYREFITLLSDGSWLDAEIARVQEMLTSYVETDPTAFFTPEEFETACATLREFCALRMQSISSQLDGSIPSTSEGQRADSSALTDASHISLDDLGEFGMGGDRGGMPDMGEMPEMGMMPGLGEMPDMGMMPGTGEMPDMGMMPGMGEMPDMGMMPEMGAMPDMGAMPGMGAMPDIGNMPGAQGMMDPSASFGMQPDAAPEENAESAPDGNAESAPDGAVADAGAAWTEIERTDTERSEAQRSEAERTQAERTDTERTDTERTDTERTEAARTAAERTESERTESERTEAARTQAERTDTERTESDRSDSARSRDRRSSASSAASATSGAGHSADPTVSLMTSALCAAVLLAALLFARFFRSGR